MQFKSPTSRQLWTRWEPAWYWICSRIEVCTDLWRFYRTQSGAAVCVRQDSVERRKLIEHLQNPCFFFSCKNFSCIRSHHGHYWNHLWSHLGTQGPHWILCHCYQQMDWKRKESKCFHSKIELIVPSFIAASTHATWNDSATFRRWYFFPDKFNGSIIWTGRMKTSLLHNDASQCFMRRM